MDVITIDFESFFSDDFTLSKLSTEAYIRDPRFEVHGAAIKWAPAEPTIWYDEPELRRILKTTEWSDAFVLHHHAHFDGLILSHCYDVHPRMFGDTLSMARLLLGNHLSVSLDSVRTHFGFPQKRTPYHLFRGKHWGEVPAEHQRLIAEGACDEVESIWTIFGLLAREFPKEEYEVVDRTIRMFTDPVLGADVDLLARIWEKENDAKAQRLIDLAIDPAELQSADKFKALLEAEGVEIEYKDGKNGPIPAFAKNDDFMRDLLEDSDERIRTLAEARIGAKSTALQTRAETLGYMANRGPLCVYLRMYGAHTTRWSGGDNCLTEDTQVLTLDRFGALNYKYITDVQIDDLVWDGEDFVKHEGVIFQGYANVIEHDAIKGTPSHRVYTDAHTAIPLAKAKKTGTAIVVCREPTSWEVESARRRR